MTTAARLPLTKAARQAKVSDVMECSGPLYERLWGDLSREVDYHSAAK